MNQQIYQKICSSFLLTLLLAQAARNKPTAYDCQELMTSSQCQCQQIFLGYEIQCPGKLRNPKIHIKVFNHRSSIVTITCNDFFDEEYQLLPALNIGNITWLNIKNCPLPSKPISYLINRLSLRKFQNFKFENKILPPNITREHLSERVVLKGLYLNISDLSLMRESFFMDLPNLRSLILHSSKISLTSNTFAALNNLEFLKLDVKNLQQLPVGIFRNQRILKILKIGKTELCNISKNLFEDLTSITELSLSCDVIESFPSDVLSLLTNLTYINLSNNCFQELPSGIFANNKKLSKVVMINIKLLTALPFGLFFNLPNLHVVHITCDEDTENDLYKFVLTDENIVRINCGLTAIPKGLFANSIEYTKISLANNKLESLRKHLFKHQFSLEYLDLSHNKLKSLPDKLFRYNKKLAVLKLSHNFLTEISRDLFSNLVKLDELHLNNNLILAIDSDAFPYNNNLRFISMDNNRINMTEAFNYLRKLEILKLSNNSLRHIFWGNNELVNLKELDLSHNFIASLNCCDLLHISNIRLSINLNSNQISEINTTCELLPETLNKNLSISVRLDNNPLDCDCNLLPFLLYLRDDQERMLHALLNFEINTLVCAKPDYMENLNLLKVEPKDLLCPLFEPPYCPLGCRCWKRTYDSVLLVNCSGNNLTDVPVLPRVQALGLKSIELHMENNELKELPMDSTYGYADITRLYVSCNELSRIDANSLPKNLTYLDLSRNKFTKLNMLNFLKGNNSIKEIALSENPWNCDCEGQRLMQFVRRSHKIILNFDKVYCESPKNSNMIEYFDNNDVCQDGQDSHIALIISMGTILIVCLAISVTAALFYKYQTEVKIWLYNYNFCPWWVNEEELDKDKTYDAFVCYSSRDEEFVIRQLVPQLENGSTRFKLCVHVRDFIVGDIIPDQIIRAIADSRRTIVVLSKNFIKSVWARMEFRLAYQAGLDEKRTKVIAIAYGEIGDISLLDLELQAYLKMTTYLEWGNPWFWDRLRYIMPHPRRRNYVH